MIWLDPMKCRICNGEITPNPMHVLKRETANSYASCYYVCQTPGCEVAYSNGEATEARTAIFKDPLRNVPVEVRSGVSDVLDRALNIRNRPSKRSKFAFHTSEDAVTWTFFRHVVENGLLPVVFGRPELQGTVEELYWGCPWPVTDNSAILSQLKTILDDLGEKSQSYSEPDFIADNGKLLLFVEVKYLAANDKKPEYKNFPIYLRSLNDWFDVDAAAVQAAGYYELVRNWVVGNMLAKQLGRTFLLINLAKSRCRSSALEFQNQLRRPDRFAFADWREVVARLPADVEPWLTDYLKNKSLSA
jgi:hypothetical protein